MITAEAVLALDRKARFSRLAEKSTYQRTIIRCLLSGALFYWRIFIYILAALSRANFRAGLIV